MKHGKSRLGLRAKVNRTYRSPPQCMPVLLCSLSGALLLIGVSPLWASDDEAPVSPGLRAPVRSNQPKPHESRFDLNINLVLVDVSVMTPMGRQVTGLQRERFRVFEDKAEQQIVHFGVEDAPISIGLIFDCSGSMGEKLAKAREAVLQFLKTANQQDEFFLIEFNERPRLTIDFTSSPEQVEGRLAHTQAKGLTALLDAIHLGLTEMRRAKASRKALLIISDGGDNRSRYTEREIKNLVKEADVQIYAIGIYEPIVVRTRTPEELAGPGLLKAMAELTGGQQFAVESLDKLPDTATQISMVLHNQYVLGYSPTNVHRDGRWRRIQVEVDQARDMPPMRVFAKRGYFAPVQ